MSPLELKNSILRLINYKDGANRARFEKSVRYVTNPAKTDNRLVLSRYIDSSNPVQSMDSLEKRWKNDEMDGRLFKHGIISFGSPDMDPEKAIELVKATMDYYKDFPYLAALHTDVPKRLHAHFLLAMRNVRTGKKFSQSISDLKKFRSHYHNLAINFDLLGLKDFMDDSARGVDMQVQEPTVQEVSYYPDYSEPMPSVSDLPYSGDSQEIPEMFVQPEYTQFQYHGPQNSRMSYGQNDIVNNIFKGFQEDFREFFLQGFRGGIYNE